MFATAHPNIVPIQYACQTPSHIVLMMPYYQHGSLADRIASGPLTLSELVRVAIGVLHGIVQIHDAGYIHFDIKPSNILFNDVNDPMVADFGQSRKILPGGRVTLPPLYYRCIPPETLRSHIGSLLGDIYQVGLLLYRATNGEPHFDEQFSGLTPAAINDRMMRGLLPDRKSFLPHVPKRIRSIIRKSLKAEPSQRYQSATEFSQAIGRVPRTMDWMTYPDPNGNITWKAQRAGKCDLEVNLLGSGSTWSVAVWTVNGGVKRAKNVLGASGLSYDDAMAHLNDVFEQLL